MALTRRQILDKVFAECETAEVAVTAARKNIDRLIEGAPTDIVRTANSEWTRAIYGDRYVKKTEAPQLRAAGQ